MNAKSSTKVMKPVKPEPPFVNQFEGIKTMALADKKKARIHRKQIFETASKRSKDPKNEKVKVDKLKKLYKEKGIKHSTFNPN